MEPDADPEHGHLPPAIVERKESASPKAYGLPIWRKCIIVFVTSWMVLAVNFSSTSLLPAIPEIAAEFSTTTEIINVTNAGVFIAMGLSTLIWGPISNLIGRRKAYNVAVFVLCGCSAGTAAAIDMPMFTAMRVLSGLTGTTFMVAGQTIIADIFEPVVRGTAVGFFMVGGVFGPAVGMYTGQPTWIDMIMIYTGPCVGGVIVTFAHWRIIYWLQVAMTGVGMILAFFFVPAINDAPKKLALTTALSTFNPLRVLRQLRYPNVLFCVRVSSIFNSPPAS